MSPEIGDRLILSPDEGFPDLMKALPRKGTVENLARSVNGDEWIIFALDHPFEYVRAQANEEPERIIASRLLIKSRWEGHGIKHGGDTGVFILVVSEALQLNEQPIDPHSFHFDGWGLCRKIES